ncbi:hypothetical protein JKP88DRAFT_158295, partial [Tribonema minus]
MHPDIAATIHHTLNGTVNPSTIHEGSTIHLWWMCTCSCGQVHEWRAEVRSRVKFKTGCPWCARGGKTCICNSLATRYPALINSLHPTRNGTLRPSEMACSTLHKYWWVCQNGHEWEASVHNRTNNQSGCPYCSGHKCTADASLAALRPGLAAQVDVARVGGLDLTKIGVGSARMLPWSHTCSCGRVHRWEAIVQSRARVSDDQGCPICSGKGNHPICACKSLLAVKPHVAAQMHPTLNGELTPDRITPASGQMVTWKCQNSQCKHEHVWEAPVYS